MPEPLDEQAELDDLDALDDEGALEQVDALDLSGQDRRLVTQPYDLGVRAIGDDIASNRISLSIEYQRKYVWDSGKASRLIESLLLNVPIPVCYFAEDEDGVYEVIDGLQRLSTIRNYLAGDFALTGISVLSELEGKRFAELAPRDQRRLESRTIRCIVITEDSHPDIKFDVFERLNTGAASLTAQELRNSVYRGRLNDGLKVLAQEPYFIAITGSLGNKRMDYEELILRFLALTSGVEQYKPPLRQFLNDYMRANRTADPDAASVQVFRAACEAALEVLGDAPFRVPGSRNLNKALFDAIMVPFAFADREALSANPAEAKAAIDQLFGVDEFMTSIGRATADRYRMLYRVGSVARALREVGIAVDLPANLGLEE